MSSVAFNNLPRKALNLIFKKLDQTQRQKLRVVCSFWKTVIDEGFPIELVITQANYDRLFRCPNAVSAEIQSLTTEYTGNVGFGTSIRSIQFTGKVLSTNIFSILRFCPNLEALRFVSLKQVLGVEGTDTMKLPKTTIVEIKVRPDQETFTSDEIIIISVLRQIRFGSLETVLITTANPQMFDNWDDDVDYDQRSGEETRSFTVSAMTPMSSGQFSGSEAATHLIPSLASREGEEGEPGPGLLFQEVSGNVSTELTTGPPENEEPQIADTTVVPQNTGTQTNATQNVNVLMNRASHFTNGANSARNRASPRAETAETSTSVASSSTSRRARYDHSDFEARLFYANLELMMERNMEPSVLDILNGSMSRTGAADSSMYFEPPATMTAALKPTVFFEFIRNNHATLRNLYIKTRADFMCFGNLSSFSRDLPKVQFEEVEYSFARTQMCYEHLLLTAQCRLNKIKIHVDDMWKHFLVAVDNSQDTLTEIDAKVICINDDNLNITPITRCHNLKYLKLLHFFEKEPLRLLPSSLNKLIVNGPVYYKDMDTWTRMLLELEDLTLLLNLRGHKIDLPLYKKFLKMPKARKLTFIQCPMELNEIRTYIDSNNPLLNGLQFWITGPKDLSEVPALQYVYTIIDPDIFNRSQVQIDETSTSIN